MGELGESATEGHRSARSAELRGCAFAPVGLRTRSRCETGSAQFPDRTGSASIKVLGEEYGLRIREPLTDAVDADFHAPSLRNGLGLVFGPHALIALGHEEAGAGLIALATDGVAVPTMLAEIACPTEAPEDVS